jgi:hypothetical protein
VRGLLGSDIWNHFGRITIDYGAGTLTVYNQTTGLRSSPTGAPVAAHLKYFGPRPETTGSRLLRTVVATSNPASRKANISHVEIGLQIQLGLVPSYM